MIYVNNVDSPNLGFQLFNFLGEAQWKNTLYKICLKLQNVFLYNCLMYLSQIKHHLDLKLHEKSQ